MPSLRAHHESLRAQHEFLYHRVRQQFTGKLSNAGQSAVIGLTAQFHLEPLALPHANHIAVSKSLAGPRDGLSLRIVNLALQHHIYNDFRHFS
jgi:hypothetical protein